MGASPTQAFLFLVLRLLCAFTLNSERFTVGAHSEGAILRIVRLQQEQLSSTFGESQNHPHLPTDPELDDSTACIGYPAL